MPNKYSGWQGQGNNRVLSYTSPRPQGAISSRDNVVNQSANAATSQRSNVGRGGLSQLGNAARKAGPAARRHRAQTSGQKFYIGGFGMKGGKRGRGGMFTTNPRMAERLYSQGKSVRMRDPVSIRGHFGWKKPIKTRSYSLAKRMMGQGKSVGQDRHQWWSDKPKWFARRRYWGDNSGKR
jgi:hypothetical protein